MRRLFEAGEDQQPGVLLRGVAAVICIGFVLWLGFAWTGYAERYSKAMEGWRIGGTHMVELTLVAQDRDNLACASATTFGDVRCGFGADRKARDPAPDEAHRLSPYKSVQGALLLGAGLWTAQDLAQPPRGRFTAVCNFHILGVTKSSSVRWQKTGEFTRVQEALPVGKLEGCVIPR